MTTQPKQYKLLQPLPLTVIGNIYFKKNNVWCENRDEPVKKDLAAILDIVENNPEWLELIVETPKSMLKYDNGAVVGELKEFQEYWCITYGDEVAELQNQPWNSHDYDWQMLYLHNVFLTEEEAQKALLQQQIYNCLYKKIRQIDEENGFVCDWSNFDQYKYYIYWDFRNQKLFTTAEAEDQNQGTTYMSEQAAQYLCSDAVTKADQKLFCGILD